MISIIIGIILGFVFCFIGWVVIDDHDHKKSGVLLIVIGSLIAIVGFALYPTVNVWQKTLSGKAALKEAEYDRQIKVREANAKLDSSKLLARAEVERAKGAAEANKIVAKSLGGPNGYLRWLYIEMLSETENNLIYVPTEAGLPILEATRLK